MSVRRLHVDGFDPVDELLVGLACCGFILEPGSRILDFGCGEGEFVYRLRDKGFDAYGFEIHNRVKLRCPEDARLFQFSPADNADTSVMTASNFAIPFPSGHFDFVFSSQVFEHLIDIDPVLAEIARVMKPGGVSLHVYPRREAILEAHMFVPWGGVITKWWWYYLWALLGVSNQHQVGKSARVLADENYRYARSGVCHRTEREMMAHVAKYFSEAWFATWRYYATSNRMAYLRSALRALRHPEKLRHLAAHGPLNVLIMRAPGN